MPIHIPLVRRDEQRPSDTLAGINLDPKSPSIPIASSLRDHAFRQVYHRYSLATREELFGSPKHDPIRERA